MHQTSDEFENEIRCDSITECGVSFGKNPHRLMMGKTVLLLFLSCFNRILFILEGNNDIHKSLDEFEIQPDLTPDHRVTCP